jgi:hypothetical protein
MSDSSGTSVTCNSSKLDAPPADAEPAPSAESGSGFDAPKLNFKSMMSRLPEVWRLSCRPFAKLRGDV